MNIVFMGTPSFAVAALEALHTEKNGRFSVKLVLTRPDAASGRGKTPVPSPVRVVAEELGIPVRTPQSFFVPLKVTPPNLAPSDGLRGARILDAELVAAIAQTEPDFIVVAAFGAILPAAVLALPRYGCINIHASLLPRWRGAAPIQRAILAGDPQAGVSIMRMEEGLDTGDWCAQAATLAHGKTAYELTQELSGMGAEALIAALPHIADGSAVWTPQDDSLVTYAEKVEKGELVLDPASDILSNVRRVLASSPQAPARCLIAGRSVTVLSARVVEGERESGESSKGTVVFHNKRLFLMAHDGAFEVLTLKPDGKKEMPAAAFALGVRELQQAQKTQQVQQVQQVRQGSGMDGGAAGCVPVFWQALDGSGA